MNYEDMLDLFFQARRTKVEMHKARGIEKARLVSKLLKQFQLYCEQEQRDFDQLIVEHEKSILESPEIQFRFASVFGGKYRPNGVFEPKATDVGVSEKGKPMTHEEANEHRVNPYFSGVREDVYSRNCQTCVVAYELRRRGYNVMAAPRGEDDATALLARGANYAWIDPKTNRYPMMRASALVKTKKQAIDWFEKTVKLDERYILTVLWEGGGGHVVILTRSEDGVLMVYDPQTGIQYLGHSEIAVFMSTALIGHGRRGFSPSIARIDNAQVNVPFIQKIIRGYRGI